MLLTFVRPYKSIRHFSPLNLPDFCVLTGVNGAGKSHLLEAIETGAVRVDDLTQDPQSRPIRRFDWTTLVPQDTGAFAPYQITQERHELWTQLKQSVQTSKDRIIPSLASINPRLAGLSLRELRNLTAEQLVKMGFPATAAQDHVEKIKQLVESENLQTTNRFLQNDPNRRRFVELLKESNPEPLIEWQEEDFYSRYPSTWKPVDVFQQSFGRLFADYKRNWFNNALKKLASTEDPTVTFLDNECFEREYGIPPWDFVNRILETAQLEFRINEPVKYEDRPYEPVLRDQVTHAEIKFGDLSSGEKILMSFAFCLYYAQDRRQLVEYPKVLLFDEIDAPLHPSMSQSLLSTIDDVLIRGHGIKVILTTHSPSTAALSNEGSLYAMFKTGDRIRKTTKDASLALLTSGVPTLSIHYENRRQVFVESQYDVGYYEPIYEKVRSKLVPEISLSFIPSGKSGQGNCDQVKDVVNQLYCGGNLTVYGIIDWDLTNTGNERVKVLGEESRYSIENYILDPLLVAAFLLREKFVTRQHLAMPDSATFLDLARSSNAELQKVAEFVLDKIKPHLATPLDKGEVDCNLIGEGQIKLPLWFLQTQGHQLEIALKAAFPPLQRFRAENELKRAIIAKVVDDLPGLISADFLKLFRAIQDYPAAS